MKQNDAILALRHKAFLYLLFALNLVSIAIVMVFVSLSIDRFQEQAKVSLAIVSRSMFHPLKDEPLPDFITGEYCAITLDKEGNVQKTAYLSDNHFLSESELADIARQIPANQKGGVKDKYVFQQNRDDKVRMITFQERKQLKHEIMMVIIIGISISIALFFIFYAFSSRLANWLVKPAEEAFKKQQQFIADCSHELKTPLAAIKANADLLEMKTGVSKEIDNIQGQTDNMAALITDLLTLSRLEELDDHASFTPLDLGELASNVCMPLEALMEEKNQRLISTFDKDLKINGNKRNLQKLISILLDNAGRNAPEKSDILVSVKKEKNRPVLTVKNIGDPIPEEKRAQLFQRFYQADSEHSAVNNFGLGLAIAKGVADEHQATIHVECADGWVSFIVTFPAA